MMDKDVSLIIDEARDSIGKFCYEECHAYCCRKGTLPIKIKELKLVSKDKNASLVFYKDQLSVILPCPSLKDDMCLIHKHEGRPKVCKEFPIFIEGDKVEIVGMCLAFRNGLFYPYIRQLESLGYKVKER